MANIIGTTGSDVFPNHLQGDVDPALPNDVLNSGWLGGDDQMSGGNGDDIYNINSAGDIVDETNFAASGIDTVQSQIASYTLTANVENLVLQQQDRTGILQPNGTVLIGISLGAPTAVSGTGNALDNTITGNSNNNFLYGMGGNDTLVGGDGGDVLYGGIGNDTLQGDAGNDSLFGEDGADTLRGGTGNDYLNGGIGNDVIIGDAGNDTLIGDAGNDTMTGGTGNDTYYVADAGDVVVELSGGGVDTVSSSVSETLDAFVDNLTLTGTAANGTGNASANVITGNGSANVLSGGIGDDTLIGNGGNDTLVGEAGNDTLTGGTGSDFFAFRSSGAGNADAVTDFVAAFDTVVLGNALDAGMAGALNPGLKGLSFIGGNLVGNTLTAGSYFENVAFAAAGVYYYDGDGSVWYNPDAAAGGEVLLGYLGVGQSGSLTNNDFILGV